MESLKPRTRKHFTGKCLCCCTASPCINHHRAVRRSSHSQWCFLALEAPAVNVCPSLTGDLLSTSIYSSVFPCLPTLITSQQHTEGYNDVPGTKPKPVGPETFIECKEPFTLPCLGGKKRQISYQTQLRISHRLCRAKEELCCGNTTTLWARPFSQFSTHLTVCSPSPCFNSSQPPKNSVLPTCVTSLPSQDHPECPCRAPHCPLSLAGSSSVSAPHPQGWRQLLLPAHM